MLALARETGFTDCHAHSFEAGFNTLFIARKSAAS
jgi:hypothetical protein